MKAVWCEVEAEEGQESHWALLVPIEAVLYSDAQTTEWVGLIFPSKEWRDEKHKFACQVLLPGESSAMDSVIAWAQAGYPPKGEA